ncbi:MAG: biotin--[acetyl-CoA-carboxylase] ligase [Desulforhabdus sp.]|jgi:BirA family biotin operon repressor/biotin-[acetyl-CoA-carboxylase] ligase|nr:biotin--[acetyl-CoA-carboxylase] ligase [Desulforhabdus sp.]
MPAKLPTHWEILNRLKAKPTTSVSGPQLASQLGISRTAVWKQIQKLNALGYSIKTHPKSGYELVDVPDLLIPEEVVPSLTTRSFGRVYYHFHQLGSTNDHAVTIAMQGAPHGSVVVAEEQTKGRGRLRREWISSARSGIYFSILLRTSLPISDAHQSTLLAAISLVRVLDDRYSLKASIKWPNDVLIANRKVAGILTEMQSDQDEIGFLVVGIGINVNHSQDGLQGPFRYGATSLAIELGNKIRRQELLANFMNQFEEDYDRLLRKGFGSFLSEFERRSSIVGKAVTIQCGKMEHSGKVAGFTPQGALRLVTEDNREEIIWVGDVTQVGGYI